MFTRPDETYEFDKNLIDLILKDEISPHYNIKNIIKDNSTILDIGAGNGILSMVMKKDGKTFTIDGIEPSHKACEFARPYYRNVYEGYVQEFLDKIDFSQYDYIVMADLIEHLTDPLAFLKKLSSLISDKTKIIIDVPNVTFASVRLSLLNGHWNYVNSGLLEKTHLRFFTKETLLELFEKSELYIERMYNLIRKYNSTEIPINIEEFSWGTIKQINKDKESNVYQYLFVLSKNKPRNITTQNKGNFYTIKFSTWLIRRIKYCLKHLF